MSTNKNFEERLRLVKEVRCILGRLLHESAGLAVMLIKTKVGWYRDYSLLYFGLFIL